MKVTFEYIFEGGKKLNFGKRWDHAWQFEESKEAIGDQWHRLRKHQKLESRNMGANGIGHWDDCGFYSE